MSQNPSLQARGTAPLEAKISSVESGGEKDAWVCTILHLASHEGAGRVSEGTPPRDNSGKKGGCQNKRFLLPNVSFGGLAPACPSPACPVLLPAPRVWPLRPMEGCLWRSAVAWRP